MKNKVVIIGAGTAGLVAAQRLSQEPGCEVTVLERRGQHEADEAYNFSQLKNSSPASWRWYHATVVEKLNLAGRIRGALKENRYGFDNLNQYPHFDLTTEGPRRRQRMYENQKDPAGWYIDAIEQDDLKEFAFITQNKETRVRSDMIKIDPIVMHRIFATGIEAKVQFGTSYEGYDPKRKVVHTDRGDIEYDIIIDASGSALETMKGPKRQDRLHVIKQQDCFEVLLRTKNGLPDGYRNIGFFRIDKTKNYLPAAGTLLSGNPMEVFEKLTSVKGKRFAQSILGLLFNPQIPNPKDRTYTACEWGYTTGEEVRFGNNNWLSPQFATKPPMTPEGKARYLLVDIGLDIINDPFLKQMFAGFGYEDILDWHFNTIPVEVEGQNTVFSEGLRVGDAGVLATQLCSEGIRPAIETGLAAAECIIHGYRPDDYKVLYQNKVPRIIYGSALGPHLYRALSTVAFDVLDDAGWDEAADRFAKLSPQVLNDIIANRLNWGVIRELPRAVPWRGLIRRGLEVLLTDTSEFIYERDEVHKEFEEKHKDEIDKLLGE